MQGFSVSTSATHVELLRRSAPHKTAVYHSTLRATTDDPRTERYDATTTLAQPLRCAAVLLRFAGKHARRRVRIWKAEVMWSAVSAAAPAPSVGAGGASGLGPGVAPPPSRAHAQAQAQASPALMALLGAMHSSGSAARPSATAPTATPHAVQASQRTLGRHAMGGGGTGLTGGAGPAPELAPRREAGASAPGSRSVAVGEASVRQGFDLMYQRMAEMEDRLVARLDRLEGRVERIESQL